MRPKQKGFTLIELMMVVAIIGVLAAVAIPSFMKYIKKTKTTEARMQLEKITNGARAYFYEEHAASTEIAVTPAQFPESNPKTPAASCCNGPGERCMPDDSLWGTPTWVGLKFGVPDPHYYQYRFESDGTGTDASFTAYAYGDLDCDTEFSTFLTFGQVQSTSEGPLVRAGASRKNELE